jgi:hypothetical protein
LPSKKSKIEEDPVLQVAVIITLISFIGMISYATQLNLLPLLVSIIGLLVGLYLIALRTYPKEAVYWRKEIIDKINLLLKWSKEMIEGYRERKRKEKQNQ